MMHTHTYIITVVSVCHTQACCLAGIWNMQMRQTVHALVESRSRQSGYACCSVRHGLAIGHVALSFFESSPASECSVGMQLGACLLFVRLNWAQERDYCSHSREKSNNRFGELLPLSTMDSRPARFLWDCDCADTCCSSLPCLWKQKQCFSHSRQIIALRVTVSIA
jgi:hypothetical protein